MNAFSLEGQKFKGVRMEATKRVLTFYEEKYCAMVTESLKNGYSLEKFAEEINVSRGTIYDWRRKYPEFRKAINEGHLAQLLEKMK